MPFQLHLYDMMESRVNAEGLGIKMVAARGTMVTVSVAKES